MPGQHCNKGFCQMDTAGAFSYNTVILMGGSSVRLLCYEPEK